MCCQWCCSWFFSSVNEREGASSTTACQPGQTLGCISVQSRQDKKPCFTSMLFRVGTDVWAYKMHPDGCQRKAFCHHILHYLPWAGHVLFCKVSRVFWNHHFQLHSCNKQGHHFNFQSAFYRLTLMPGFTVVVVFSLSQSLLCLALPPPHWFKTHKNQLYCLSRLHTELGNIL